MKKKIFIYLGLIALCAAVFFGYRAIDRARTDTMPPVITLEEGTLRVSVSRGEKGLLEGVTALDGVDGDVTASLVVESVTLSGGDGTVSVVYAAFDAAGNVAKAERVVQFTDYESPRFALKYPLVFPENSGFDVLTCVTAEDQTDGDITHWVRATSLDESTVATAGTHEVRFWVTNSMGDTAQIVLPVEVYAVGTYQGTLALSDYLIYMKAGELFDPKDYPVSYTLNGKTLSLNGVLPEGVYIEIIDEVDPNTPGIYTVGYLLTYNTVYTGYSKLIVVVE